MYQKILVALENSRADEALLPHIIELAKLHDSELVLVHVADGFVARNYDQSKLAQTQEMKDDRAYLESSALKLRSQGFKVSTLLELGDRGEGILKAAQDGQCDLIAMTAHAHRHLGDLLSRSAIDTVR